jgi:hypothetical protein
MKRVIASASLAALGAVGVQAAGYSPDFGSTDLSKPWSVSATLRGFYDDNYNTAPDKLPNGAKNPVKRDSFGFNVSPSASVAWSNDQTDLGARYRFGMYYFADRPQNNEDYTHQFDGFLSHNFSPRFNVYVSDAFVMAQEPEVLAGSGPTATYYRTKGDNLRNNASLNLNAQVTQLLTLVVGYQNTIYDYSQSAQDVVSAANPIGGGSYSALLDRMEHLILLNLRWQALPSTVGVAGYQFGILNYTANEYLYAPLMIAGAMAVDGAGRPLGLDGNPVPKSNIRDSYNHYMYAGVDHTFNPDLTLSLRGGAQYTDLHRQSYTDWGPYVNVSLRYRYAVGSYAELGYMQSFSPTEILANNVSASVGYATINQQILPNLVGSVTGRMQYSKYNGGSFDKRADYYYLVGLNLTYSFNRHLSAEAGYNLDVLDSKSMAHWDFTRNRVYVGVTAKY